MRLFRALLLLQLLIWGCASADLEARLWTANNGDTVDANFVSTEKVGSEFIVHLRNAKGKDLYIPADSLSAADIRYLKLDSMVKPRSEPTETNESEDSEESEIKKVVCKGMGETMEAAKKDALRNAIEKTLGSIVESETVVKNDEMMEQILTASSGYVNKHRMLKITRKSGIFTVTIEADVVKNAITQKLGIRKIGQTLNVDGESLLGKMETKSESEKNGALVLAQFLKKEKFPYSLLDVSFITEPFVEHKGEIIEYTCRWRYSVKMDEYDAFVERLTPLLDEFALRKCSFNTKFYRYDRGIHYSIGDVPTYDGENTPFCVCTGVAGSFAFAKWDCYDLPNKYMAVFANYARLVPVVQLKLLGAGDSVIKSNYWIIQAFTDENDKEWDAFNLLNSMESSFYREKVSSVQTSTTTIINSNSQNEYLMAIFPFCKQDWWYYKENTSRQRVNVRMGVLPRRDFSVTFTLTPEELGAVRSVNLSVVTQNPKMTRALQELPKLMSNISTK